MADCRVYDWVMKSTTPTKRPIYISPTAHKALKQFSLDKDIKISAAAEMAVVAMISKAAKKAASK